MYKPRVYTASKLHRYPEWMKLRFDPAWDFIQWTATWPIKLHEGAEEGAMTTAQYARFWVQDVNEVKLSDFVLVLHDQNLRGALVEAGVMLALQGRVLAVGFPHGDTWTYHPLVTRCRDMEEARNHLFRYTVMVPPASTKRQAHDQESD